MSVGRPAGVSAISLLLGTLGAVTLLAFPIGLARSAPGSVYEWALALLGAASGAAAVLSARLLWRLSERAPEAFLAWCLSIVAFNVTLAFEVAALRDLLMIPSLVLAVALFILGYRYTARACRPSA